MLPGTPRHWPHNFSLLSARVRGVITSSKLTRGILMAEKGQVRFLDIIVTRKSTGAYVS